MCVELISMPVAFCRGPLNELVRDVFPVLQQLLQHVLEQNTLEAANIIKLILKSFWSATQYMLPETLRTCAATRVRYAVCTFDRLTDRLWLPSV